MSFNRIIKGSVPAKSNQYRISGNRLYKAKEVKDYERIFALQYNRHETITTPFSISVKVYMGNKRADLDNSLKGIMDNLQQVGAIQNDCLCIHIEATKFIDKTNPRIEIELTKI